jgi:hypothetical protein
MYRYIAARQRASHLLYQNILIPTLILHTSLLQPHQMTSILIGNIIELNANVINNRAVQFQ